MEQLAPPKRPRAAEDLTQSFFARMLEKNYLQHGDAARGRFRSFLLAAVTHFAANEADRDAAKKRGGRVVHIRADPALVDIRDGPLTIVALAAKLLTEACGARPAASDDFVPVSAIHYAGAAAGALSAMLMLSLRFTPLAGKGTVQ